MITNEAVFADDHIPVDVVHRNQELNLLTQALDPATHGAEPLHAFCFGPSGTGKTVTARWLVGELGDYSDVAAAYLNCWDTHAPWPVLQTILEGLTGPTSHARQSTPRDVLLDSIARSIDGPAVAILDEVDRLDDLDLLYQLHRVDGLGLVCIANDGAELFARLDERTQSRLRNGVEVTFDAYSVGEIVDILERRARAGLADWAWREEQLETIATAAEGNARVAINALRVAARQAATQGDSELTDAVIEGALPEARAQIRQKTVDRLKPGERVLFDIIADAGEIQSGDLHEAYERTVEDPVNRRQRRNYLDKMERYNLIESEGQTRWKTYSAVEPRSPPPPST